MTRQNLPFKRIVVLTVLVVFATGCQSAFKKPDFSRLAFWKKDAAELAPPPPARHFDPTGLDGERPTRQVADRDRRYSTDSLDTDLPDLGDDNIDNKIAGSGFDYPQAKRYSADEPAAPKSRSNSFELDANRIQSDFAAGANQFGGQLTSAQQDFAADMNSIKNDVADGLADKISAAKQGLANTIDAGEATVQTGLYDAAGRLVKKGEDAKIKSLEAIQDKTNDFRAQLESRVNTANDKADEFQQSTKSKIESLSAKAGELVNRPFPKFGDPEATASASKEELLSMQDKLLQARAEYEKLKQEIEASKAAKLAQAPTDNATIYGSLAPAKTAAPVSSATDNGFSATLRPQTTQPAPSNVLRPQAPATPTGKPDDNGFPATPYNGFKSSQTQPRSSGQQVNSFGVAPAGFEGSAQPETGKVSQANSLMPLGGSSIKQASRIENHVDDVKIPDVILTGEGSFSPGSVNRLKRR